MTRLLVDPATDFDDPAAVTITATLLDPGPSIVRTFTDVTTDTVVDLPAPDTTEAWRLTIRRPVTTINRWNIASTNPGPIVEERTVHFPDVPSVPWASLTDVDPATLRTTAVPGPAWDAAIAELQAEIDGLPTGGGGGGGAVASVNAKTGAVVLGSADIGADPAGAATMAQAFAVQRANHTGTQSADTLTDGTTAKAYLATERAKLAGIAAGATANRADTATDAAIAAATAALVNAAPSTLDTLGELATALIADEGTAATLTALVGTKAPLASPAFTGTPTIGGTAVAKTNDVTAAVAAQATAAAATYLPAVGLGPRLVWFGDSITQGATDNENQSYGNSYPLYAQLLLRGSGWTVRNAGIGGNTTGAMLGRFDTDVTPYAPNVVVILGGTNDIAQGSPLSYFQGNITGIVAKVRAIGATPVLTTIPPIDLADRHAATSLYNLWLTRYAASIGAPLIDLYSILVDPATGNYRSGFSVEGVHPTPASMMLMGQVAANVLTDYLRPWTLPLVGANDDSLQILSNNPLFLTDSNGDGTPDGFDHYGDSNVTVSLVTDPNVPGKMVRLDAAAASGVHIFERYINTGFAAGDHLVVAGVLSTGGGITTQIKIDFQAAGKNAFAVNATLPAISNGIFYQDIVVPAGVTPGSYLGFMVQAGGGTGYLQVGRFTVYNLTALGLA